MVLLVYPDIPSTFIPQTDLTSLGPVVFLCREILHVLLCPKTRGLLLVRLHDGRDIFSFETLQVLLQVALPQTIDETSLDDRLTHKIGAISINQLPRRRRNTLRDPGFQRRTLPRTAMYIYHVMRTLVS